MAKRLNMQEFGKRIAAVRAERGITQQALSTRTGLKQAAISRLECGNQAAVRADTVMGLAAGLRVSADWLLGLGESLPGHLHYLPGAEGGYEGCCAACNEPAGQHVTGCVGERRHDMVTAPSMLQQARRK